MTPNKDFQWTDELVATFFMETYTGGFYDLPKHVKDFKETHSSRLSNVGVDWEIAGNKIKTTIWQDREFGFKVIAELPDFIFLPIGGKVFGKGGSSYKVSMVQYMVDEDKIEIIVIPY